MTRSKYFFYPKNEEELPSAKRHEAERLLPNEESAKVPPPSFAFRAGNATLSRPLVQSAEAMTSTILSDLSSIGSRMASKKLAAPFSSFLSLLFNFCEDFSNVTVNRAANRDICIATCTHNLLFAIGTVVLYAAAEGVPLEIISGEDRGGAMIRLYTEAASLTPDEAAEHFGLSPYRLAILKRIAAASDFTIEITPADRSCLTFRAPIYTPDTYRIFAIGDPTLREAFMQPLLYFVF